MLDCRGVCWSWCVGLGVLVSVSTPGRWSGTGKFVYGKTGDEYSGGMRRGKFHGLGVLTFKKGGFYEGNFKVKH